MKHLKRILLAVACSAAIFTPVAHGAPVAPGATLVTLGDSFTATAPVIGWSGDGCTRSATSWPNQLAGSMGIAGSPAFVDVSCNGATLDSGDGWTIVHQARKASALGAFGPGTKAVLIQLGLNDTWGASPGHAFPSVDCLLNLPQGCGFDAVAQGRLPDFNAVSGGAYAARMRAAVDYIKYYAPNARIAIVGYPEIFPSGQPAACLAFPLGNFIQPHAEGYIAYLDRLNDAQRSAAQSLGIGFVDARAVTAHHGSCAPDSWISGLDGMNSVVNGAPIHPSPFGNGVLAGAIRRQLSL